MNGLGPGDAKSHAFGRRHQPDDCFRQFDLSLMLRRVDLAEPQLTAGSLNYFGICMSKDQRPATENIVDVLVTVYVEKAGTRSGVEV